MHPLDAFFPHAFDALPVVIVRPPARWDGEDAGDWDELGAEAEALEPLEELVEFGPMPGEIRA